MKRKSDLDWLETLVKEIPASPTIRLPKHAGWVSCLYFFFFFSICLTHTDTIPRNFMSRVVNPACVCSSPVNSWLSRQAFWRQESRLEAPSVRPSSWFGPCFSFIFIFFVKESWLSAASRPCFSLAEPKNDDNVNTEQGEVNKQTNKKIRRKSSYIILVFFSLFSTSLFSLFKFHIFISIYIYIYIYSFYN